MFHSTNLLFYFPQKNDSIERNSLTNTAKGNLGESGSFDGYSSWNKLILRNVKSGSRGADIDNLILTESCTIIDEDKNVNMDFELSYEWLCSHIIDRYAKALPIAQYYARTIGYSQKVNFQLTISTFVPSDPIVQHAIKGLNIKVIETGVQALNETSKKVWANTVKAIDSVKAILSKESYNKEKEVTKLDKEFFSLFLNKIINNLLKESAKKGGVNDKIQSTSEETLKIFQNNKVNKSGVVEVEKSDVKTINKCPECGSSKVMRQGKYRNRTGLRQRYQCLNCGKVTAGEYLDVVTVKAKVTQ